MPEKLTRILEIEVTSKKVFIGGDVYIKGNLSHVFSDSMEFEVRGKLWIDGNVKMENCEIIAESIEIGGNCSCESLLSTKGSIKLYGDKHKIKRLNSHKDIDIKGYLSGEYFNNDIIRAKGQIQLCKCCGYEGIYVNQDVTIKLLTGIAIVKGKNVYIEKVGCSVSKIYAKDSLYIQTMIEKNGTELKAKEIIIDD